LESGFLVREVEVEQHGKQCGKREEEQGGEVLRPVDRLFHLLILNESDDLHL